ncbi:MAG TPA: adenosylcobinamide-GDP ribazoletransferase, partial [Aquihabitans sp.]|nr:adenosylcobinamide-GDP ribazoletransferase [Aquihabitans sp.]
MIQALAFLTVAGTGATPDARTMRWFPLTGAAIGIVVGGAWWLAGEAFPPLLAGAVVVAVDLAVTGLLHVDGLADSADGLLPHLDRDRRLAVMAEPAAGAFAVAVVAAVLVLRAAALGSRPADLGLVVGLWCASRSAMALVALTRPYARPGGLASSFLGDRAGPAIAVAGIVAGGALATATDGVAGLAAVVALVVAAGAVVALAHRRLGGFTGDV